MKLNRELQLRVLNQLSCVYPNRLDLQKEIDVDKDELVANLIYLQEHELLESGAQAGMGSWIIGTSKITAKGMDFIADDGGLSAILGTVTVRLHDDTIKSLLEARISSSDLPPADKKRYIDQLKELPAAATKHLAMKLLDAGVDAVQSGAIGQLIGSVL